MKFLIALSETAFEQVASNVSTLKLSLLLIELFFRSRLDSNWKYIWVQNLSNEDGNIVK